LIRTRNQLLPEDAEKRKFAIKLQFQIIWSFNWDKKDVYYYF